MRQVNIFVEGSKDAYFLHELILQRFANLFARNSNKIENSIKQPEKGEPAIPVKMKSIKGNIRLCIYAIGGYGKIKSYGNELRVPATMRGTGDEFASAIVFDSDIPPPAGVKNENKAGQAERSKSLLLKLQIKASGAKTSASKHIFLFPDNKQDGDLEVLLRGIVNPTADHLEFFNTCWKGFETCLGIHRFNAPTRKSMMNEYKAAFDKKAWEIGGLNRCMENSSLWDWQASVLNPIVEFLSNLMTGNIKDGLADNVSAGLS